MQIYYFSDTDSQCKIQEKKHIGMNFTSHLILFLVLIYTHMEPKSFCFASGILYVVLPETIRCIQIIHLKKKQKQQKRILENN